jgi:hypothetical protein
VALCFDEVCLAVIEKAKASLFEDEMRDISSLLAALYHTTSIKDRLPQFSQLWAVPQEHCRPGKVPLTQELKEALRAFRGRTLPITADELFCVLRASDAGRQQLVRWKFSEQQVTDILEGWQQQSEVIVPMNSWRYAPDRRAAIEALSPFGRVLTDMKPRRYPMMEFTDALHALLTNLSRMRNRSTIILGFPCITPTHSAKPMRASRGRLRVARLP